MTYFNPEEITKHLYVDLDKRNFYNRIYEIKGSLEEGIAKKDTTLVLSTVGDYKKLIEEYANKETTHEAAQLEIPDFNYFTKIADAMYAIEAVSMILQEKSTQRTLEAIAKGRENLETLYKPIGPIRSKRKSRS